jgi:hypothetical protein
MCRYINARMVEAVASAMLVSSAREERMIPGKLCGKGLQKWPSWIMNETITSSGTA